MLKVLLIESDKQVRDIIKVALGNFQQFEVDHAEDAWGVEMARQKSYDLVITNLKLGGHIDGMALVKEIRDFDVDVEILVLTHGRSSRLLSKEKALQGIAGIIPLPVEEVSLYKTLARVKDRIEAKHA